MKTIDARLRAIERQREASKPPSPWLVIRSNETEAEALARFKAQHGCEPEPGHIIRIMRASIKATTPK